MWRSRGYPKVGVAIDPEETVAAADAHATPFAIRSEQGVPKAWRARIAQIGIRQPRC